MTKRNYHIFALSESTLTVQFEKRIAESQVRSLHDLKSRILANAWPAVLDILVTFHELSVIFDPDVESFASLQQKMLYLLKNLDEPLNTAGQQIGKRYIIPVCYDEEMAWDQQRMEEKTGLPFSKIISLHSGSEYLIYMFGFLPGFMYLGGLHDKLFCPRLEVPRQKILPGSIGIAGGQTGIYPMASPGGWNIIGRTPLSVMNFDSEPTQNRILAPVTFQPLDHIRFTAISLERFKELEGLSIEAFQKTRES